jgi:23S rRNA (pseudouridine1915-N3)-methyltransferase
MRIRLLAIKHKSPPWIQQGYEEYAKRLPTTCTLELIEIPLEKRIVHTNHQRATKRESEKMLATIHPSHHIIALDVKGYLWTTEQLSQQLASWRQSRCNVDLLIGGPEGLSPQCLQKANKQWSLSPLTFPHILVPLIIAEQIYRAWSILQQHPYHR